MLTSMEVEQGTGPTRGAAAIAGVLWPLSCCCPGAEPLMPSTQCSVTLLPTAMSNPASAPVTAVPSPTEIVPCGAAPSATMLLLVPMETAKPDVDGSDPPTEIASAPRINIV